jgi:hypothetical protein
LAAGGLAIFRPVVSGRGGRWRVRISAEAADWREIEERVIAWLGRRGTAEASIEVDGVSTVVFARPTTGQATTPPAEPTAVLSPWRRGGLPEDSF